MATNPVSKSEMHVLVIGAGLTGLLVAQGLQKAGIKVSVFEYEASPQTYRPREWTMGIHWALPLLESLLPDSLRSRLEKEAYVDPSLDWEQSPCDRMRMINGLTGDVLKDIVVKGKIVRVSRRRLRAFLAEGVAIEYDRQLVDIKHDSDGVTAVFANGTESRGTLVVGCDGPKSAVRNLLLGPEKAAAQPLKEVVHCNTSICFNDAEKAKFVRSSHPVWAMVMHPDLFSFTSIVEVPDQEKPETWRFQVAGGWLGDREAFPDSASRLAEFKRRGNNLCEPFRSAIQWLPNDMPVTFDLISYWESKPWDTDKGRVTLAGDAAHPMPPHRGQGLNHAIQDVYNLVDLLTKSSSALDDDRTSLATQIQDYSDEVARRGADEVNMSRQNAFMALNWKTLQQSPLMKHSLDRSPKTDDGSILSKENDETRADTPTSIERGSGAGSNEDSDKENEAAVGIAKNSKVAAVGA